MKPHDGKLKRFKLNPKYEHKRSNGMTKRRNGGSHLQTPPKEPEPNIEPDWQTRCIVCDAVPTIPETEMCGPCTFGEADTVGGNW